MAFAGLARLDVLLPLAVVVVFLADARVVVFLVAEAPVFADFAVPALPVAVAVLFRTVVEARPFVFASEVASAECAVPDEAVLLRVPRDEVVPFC